MTEDDISVEMFRAARDEPEVELVSWQGVGGKSYFTASVRLVKNGQMYWPDLILVVADELWIIEVKGSHQESLGEDEPKIERLRRDLGPDEIRDQVRQGAKVEIASDVEVAFAVAYSAGTRTVHCGDGVRHVEWEVHRPDLLSALKHA